MLNKIENHYTNLGNSKKIIRTNGCGEHGCKFKGVNSKEYIVFNGDIIEKFINKSQQNKSVDCIIIQKEPLDDGGYSVFLCELTGGKKTALDLKEKFINSGKEISKTFNHYGLKISSFRCIFIGKLKDNNIWKRELEKHFYIPGLKVNGEIPNDNIILNYSCKDNISIKDFIP